MIDRNSAQWNTIIGLLADMVEAGRADLVEVRQCSSSTRLPENARHMEKEA